MSLTLQSGRRYDMPVGFGPSQVPDLTTIKEASVLAFSFATSREAVEQLLPAYFSAPETPQVNISHVCYRDVDYLGGRGYNEIVVTVSAIANDNGEPMEATFAPVLWVNQVGALIAGREFMGLAKLYADIPDLHDSAEGVGYRFAEYERDLLRVEAYELRELDGAALEKVQRRAQQVQTFGWKYIASPELQADVDYPLVNVMRWDYQRAWSGKARFEFIEQDRQSAPFSHEVVRVLSQLPVEGPIRAFRGEGSAFIDRAATRRLVLP